jgi:hypothetical protein
MATPVRLARRPKARPAAPEAAPDRFETFMTTLEDALLRRMDASPPDSQWCAALFDVYMSVKLAAKAAGDK